MPAFKINLPSLYQYSVTLITTENPERWRYLRAKVAPSSVVMLAGFVCHVYSSARLIFLHRSPPLPLYRGHNVVQSRNVCAKPGRGFGGHFQPSSKYGNGELRVRSGRQPEAEVRVRLSNAEFFDDLSSA